MRERKREKEKFRFCLQIITMNKWKLFNHQHVHHRSMLSSSFACHRLYNFRKSNCTLGIYEAQQKPAHNIRFSISLVVSLHNIKQNTIFSWLFLLIRKPHLNYTFSMNCSYVTHNIQRAFDDLHNKHSSYSTYSRLIRSFSTLSNHGISLFEKVF